MRTESNGIRYYALTFFKQIPCSSSIHSNAHDQNIKKRDFFVFTIVYKYTESMQSQRKFVFFTVFLHLVELLELNMGLEHFTF